jgi:hypothetical protein
MRFEYVNMKSFFRRLSWEVSVKAGSRVARKKSLENILICSFPGNNVAKEIHLENGWIIYEGKMRK